MKRRQLIVTAAVLAGLITPPWAIADSSLSTYWELIPDSARPHPKAKVFVLMVPEDMTVTTCDFSYRHARKRFNTATGWGDATGVTLKAKGSVTASLQVLRGAETIEIGRQKIKVQKSESEVGPSRRMRAYWADTSGLEDATGDKGMTSAEFPLLLRAGDLLSFSFKFKKAAALLGVERTGDLLQTDRLSLSAGCETCGTNDHPCPER